MKKTLLSFAICILMHLCHSQSIFNFENKLSDTGKVLNGKDGELVYTEIIGFDTLLFPTRYANDFGGYWAEGWAFSSKHDSATVKTSFTRHLFCNKNGKGHSSSNVFLIGQQDAVLKLKSKEKNAIAGFHINNNTAAYNSMLLGDDFGKKFGGNSGTDPDYFLLTAYCYGWKNGKDSTYIDSVNLYLADFRGNTNSDYILKEWTWMAMPKSKDIQVNQVKFKLRSTDNGGLGMNTPAYFALDFLSVESPLSNPKLNTSKFNIFPNPATDKIYLNAKELIQYFRIKDLSGKTIYQQKCFSNKLELATTEFQSGIYFIEVETASGMGIQKITIQ